VLAFVKKALQHNLSKQQFICPWQGNAHEIGALDGLFRKLDRLEKLKEAAMRRHGHAHGSEFAQASRAPP
jgi:hypothetical protein